MREVHVEYCYDLETCSLLSTSEQYIEEDLESNVIYTKKDTHGNFIEKYIHGEEPNQFYSVDEENKINNSYKRYVQEDYSFDYSCNIKYVKDDKIKYYAQNPVKTIDSFPEIFAKSINTIYNVILKDRNIVEIIFAKKENNRFHMYFVTCDDCLKKIF